MKTICKFLVAAAAVFFLTNGAIAQSSVGVRGGFSMYTVKNFPVAQEGLDLEEGVVFGNFNAISFEIGLSPMFAIQPEVNYIQKGGKLTSSSENEFSLRVKMDYLETPLLAKLRMGKGPLRGYVIAGPSVGYALNGETRISIDDFSAKDKIKFDDSYGADGRKDNRWDFSAVAGGGVQYKIGPGSIVLDARATYDFNDYNKFEGSAPSGHKKTRWEGLSASLGYQFEFGGK